MVFVKILLLIWLDIVAVSSADDEWLVQMTNTFRSTAGLFRSAANLSDCHAIEDSPWFSVYAKAVNTAVLQYQSMDDDISFRHQTYTFRDLSEAACTSTHMLLQTIVENDGDSTFVHQQDVRDVINEFRSNWSLSHHQVIYVVYAELVAALRTHILLTFEEHSKSCISASKAYLRYLVRLRTDAAMRVRSLTPRYESPNPSAGNYRNMPLQTAAEIYMWRDFIATVCKVLAVLGNPVNLHHALKMVNPAKKSPLVNSYERRLDKTLSISPDGQPEITAITSGEEDVPSSPTASNKLLPLTPNGFENATSRTGKELESVEDSLFGANKEVTKLLQNAVALHSALHSVMESIHATETDVIDITRMSNAFEVVEEMMKWERSLDTHYCLNDSLLWIESYVALLQVWVEVCESVSDWSDLRDDLHTRSGESAIRASSTAIVKILMESKIRPELREQIVRLHVAWISDFKNWQSIELMIYSALLYQMHHTFSLITRRIAVSSSDAEKLSSLEVLKDLQLRGELMLNRKVTILRASTRIHHASFQYIQFQRLLHLSFEAAGYQR